MTGLIWFDRLRTILDIGPGVPGKTFQILMVFFFLTVKVSISFTVSTLGYDMVVGLFNP